MGDLDTDEEDEGMRNDRDATATADHMLDYVRRTYREPGEVAALRCALSDAAHLCDAIERDILWENKGRGGKGATTKRGRELAAIAKRCGDTIFAMRSKLFANPLKGA